MRAGNCCRPTVRLDRRARCCCTCALACWPPRVGGEALLIVVRRRLVVGSGRCGRGLGVGVAIPTSARGGRRRRRAGRQMWRTGAGARCRSARSARTGVGGGVLGEGRHHQEGVGEHRQRGPAVPGAPAADLVLVQATQALAGLEALLDAPAAASSLHLGQTGKRWGSRTGANRNPQSAVMVPPSMAARAISSLRA
jgi:hypothetical protein